MSLARRLSAEFTGTGLLVAAVLGSGIAAARLSPHDIGLQLLENAIATAFALGVLILMFGPASGAHFNPVYLLRTETGWQVLGREGGADGCEVVHYFAARPPPGPCCSGCWTPLRPSCRTGPG